MRVRSDQRFETGFRNGIRPPIGIARQCGTAGDEYRAAGVRELQQRIERADQAPIGGQIDVDRLLELLGRDMPEGRQRAENAGVADEDVEAAEAFVQRRAEAVDLVAVLEIERQQRRAFAARPLDLVVELFERARRAAPDGRNVYTPVATGMGSPVRRNADGSNGCARRLPPLTYTR